MDKESELTDRKSGDESRLSDQTGWPEFPWLALKGFLMGTADIIPGVSGGTMALITGIYDRLVNAIRSVDHRFISLLLKRQPGKLFRHLHWRFLLILITGIVAAVGFFTRVVPLQLYMHSHPEIVYGLFFGLILGSAILLLMEIKSGERTAKLLLPLAGGIATGYWIVTLVPADTPVTFAFLFLSGLLSFSAMILPGISGSYILIILGKYDYVLTQLGELGGAATGSAAWALLPLFLGGACGLALFARLLSWLLRNYHSITLVLLVGFLLGSLYTIWPFQERVFEERIVQSELHPLNDPFVRQLQQEEPDTNRPSYYRLGATVTPDTPAGEPQIEVERVRRTLVHSRPYLPGADEPADKLPQGAAGTLAGLLLVGGLDYLRRKK